MYIYLDTRPVPYLFIKLALIFMSILSFFMPRRQKGQPIHLHHLLQLQLRLPRLLLRHLVRRELALYMLKVQHT